MGKVVLKNGLNGFEAAEKSSGSGMEIASDLTVAGKLVSGRPLGGVQRVTAASNVTVQTKDRLVVLAVDGAFDIQLPAAKEGAAHRLIWEVEQETDNRTLLLSGFLEGSNVKSVDELVAGIDQSRAYEINVKFVTTAKEIDEATASLMRMPS